jgi:hypothetical protein
MERESSLRVCTCLVEELLKATGTALPDVADVESG